MDGEIGPNQHLERRVGLSRPSGCLACRAVGSHRVSCIQRPVNLCPGQPNSHSLHLHVDSPAGLLATSFAR